MAEMALSPYAALEPWKVSSGDEVVRK